MTACIRGQKYRPEHLSHTTQILHIHDNNCRRHRKCIPLSISYRKRQRCSAVLMISDASTLEPEIIPVRFTHVPFEVKSSPFLLIAAVQHHLNGCTSQLLKKTSCSTYVDDVVFVMTSLISCTKPPRPFLCMEDLIYGSC